MTRLQMILASACLCGAVQVSRAEDADRKLPYCAGIADTLATPIGYGYLCDLPGGHQTYKYWPEPQATGVIKTVLFTVLVPTNSAGAFFTLHAHSTSEINPMCDMSISPLKYKSGCFYAFYANHRMMPNPGESNKPSVFGARLGGMFCSAKMEGRQYLIDRAEVEADYLELENYKASTLQKLEADVAKPESSPDLNEREYLQRRTAIRDRKKRIAFLSREQEWTKQQLEEIEARRAFVMTLLPLLSEERSNDLF